MIRKQLVFILIIILAPLIIAKVLFHYQYKGKTKQQGILTTKVININQFTSLPIAKNKWHILYVDNGQSLIDRKNIMLNINRIFNAHQTELNRLMITIIQVNDLNFKTIYNKHLPTEIFSLNNQQINKLLNALDANDQIIALIDPRGFVPLVYKNDNWPIDFNLDLKTLMKLSQIG